MKKEIMNMLVMDGKSKIFKINDVFYLESNQIDRYGVNTEVSHKEPYSLCLELKCNVANNASYSLSMKIHSRKWNDLETEISNGMQIMLGKIADKMQKNFLNGYV